MAKYSVSIYGRDRSIYGTTSDNTADYVVQVTATPNWYNSIEVTWGGLSENIENNPITYWKLVRSPSGVPDHPDFAEKIAGGAYRAGGVSSGSVDGWTGRYLDNVPSARANSAFGMNLYAPGTQLTYSLWGYDELEWKLLGFDHAMIVRGEGQTLYKILRTLPGSWVTSGPVGYMTGEPEDNDLSLFLSGFAFYYDLLRTKTFALSRSSDYTLIPAQLLDGVIQNYGFVREPALGDSYHRTLYKSGYYINSYKGTENGVSAFISALTHWGSEINLGNNLMLDSSDASFEYSVGSWVGPVVFTKYEDVGFDSPYNDLLLQRTDGYYTSNIGFGDVTLQTGGIAALTCGYSNPITLGIPVDPGNAYEFSVYCRRGTDSTSHDVDIQVNIQFYNKYGVLDSTYDVGELYADVPLTWTRYSVSSVKIPVTADIKYATVAIDFLNGTHNKHVYIDMASFGIKGTQSQYQDARKTMITLYGTRENLIPNPGFDDGSSGWYAINDDSEFGIIPVATSEAHYGGYVGKVVAVGASSTEANELSVNTTWIPVLPNSPLTFSAYLSNKNLDDKVAKVKFTFSMSQNQAERIVENSQFVSDPYIIESEEFDIDTLPNGRISFSAQTPQESIFGIYPSVQVSIIFPVVENGDTFYIDSCLLEHTSEVRTYFQGNGAPLPSNAYLEEFIEGDDTKWESGEIVNFVQNPSFATNTAGWSGVTRVVAADPYGQVTAAGTASTVLALPVDFEPGTSLTASIYVKGTANSVYTIGLNGPTTIGTPLLKQFKVPGTDWTRLFVTTSLYSSDGTVTFQIGSTDASNWFIDKAQVQIGEYATKFVGPEIGGTDLVTEYNAAVVDTVYMWKYWGYKNAGRSYYFPKFFNKITRLNDTLENYLPMFSNFEIIYGDDYYKRLNSTPAFLKEFSFVNSLEGWEGDGTDYVYRNVVVPPDYSMEGTSYAVAGVDAAGTYSFKSPLIKVSANTNYHVSAAVREKFGEDVFMNIYLYLDGTETPTPIEATTTTTGNSVWSYLRVMSEVDNVELFNTGDNLFVQIEIGSTTAETGGSEIHIDRVILRPH